MKIRVGTQEVNLQVQGPTYSAGDGIEIRDTGTGPEICVAIPTKSLTQEEYDALTEEEKQADVVYIVDKSAWKPVPLSIQEYDTEDGWHVRKWSDGYVEMVYSFEFAPAKNWSKNILYSKTITEPVKMPIHLSHKISEVICSFGGNSYGYITSSFSRDFAAPNEYTMGWSAYRQTDITDSELPPNRMSITVTGRWK